MSTVTCPSCGRETDFEPSWKYCTKCGGRLSTNSSIETTAPATRSASRLTQATPGQSAAGASMQVGPSATGTNGKPSKAFTYFVLLAFCFGGAVAGGLVGLALHSKGADFATAGIAAGAGAGYEYLRRKGAFTSKKRQA
jgi:hypothetical protein